VEGTDNPAKPATAGVSMGFTIPGPKNTFLSARIDAWCSVPCGNSDEEIQGAMTHCCELIQNQLADSASVAQEFLDALSG
jgi:hypothetical protein